MIRIAVIDNENGSTDRTIMLINKYFPKEVNFHIYPFLNGKEFINSTLDYDIVYADIEFNPIFGLEIIKQFRQINSKAVIFFIALHTNYIVEIFRLDTFQILEKPIKEEDFRVDLTRAIKKISDLRPIIKVRTNEGVVIVNISSIIYIEVYQKKIKVHTDRKLYEHKGCIGFYEKKLKRYGFLKSHKSYLINMKYIKRIEKDGLELKNFNRVPLSRNYKQLLLNEYDKIIS